jgi:1-acyl-sn-glycerol-3-phosphate acyltransferase
MIYYLVRGYTSFILEFFTKKITVEGLENLPTQGAVLVASNHPNSFLDAVILNKVIDRPLWSLARGDAFKKAWVHNALTSIYMMPVYRGSEGREYLQKNDATFEACQKLFNDKGQVLIFSEGICENQSALLPLKKGTARLAQQVWQTGQDLLIVPVGLTYDSYSTFGKNVRIIFGKPILKSDFSNLDQDGFFTRSFNEKLNSQLVNLAHQPLPAVTWKDNPLMYIGIVLNWPIYLLFSNFVRNKTKGTVFFDSIFFGTLTLALPLYWIFIIFLLTQI